MVRTRPLQGLKAPPVQQGDLDASHAKCAVPLNDGDQSLTLDIAATEASQSDDDAAGVPDPRHPARPASASREPRMPINSDEAAASDATAPADISNGQAFSPGADNQPGVLMQAESQTAALRSQLLALEEELNLAQAKVKRARHSMAPHLRAELADEVNRKRMALRKMADLIAEAESSIAISNSDCKIYKTYMVDPVPGQRAPRLKAASKRR